MTAFTDAVETIAGRHNPSVRRRTLAVATEVFEDGWVLRRKRGKVVDGFVYSRRQARRCYIVSKNAAIYHLCEKSRLRNQLFHQVRYISLAFGRECLLVA